MKRCVFLSVAMITVLLASCFFSTEIKAESVTWNTENATIKIGEEKQIAISVSPENITGEIKYTLSNSEIVEIIHKSNNGVIVKGLKYGSTVLLAQIDNKESYVQIVVDDELEGSTPYIKTTIAEEMKIGDTKTISVELYGVEEARKSLCEWEIENDNISVRDIGSSILVTASKVGKTRIEVSHPDCQYKESIMVYVTTEGREAIYLTTKTPVIKMASNGETENITVQLVGSSSLHYCQFRVVEGKEYIDIISNNNVCSITPKNVGGMAIIEASHPECEESIKIRVIVVDTKKEISIECEDFVYLDTEEKKITAILKNEEDTEKYKEFTYKINNENIRVTQVNNDFYLTPLKNGRTVLTLLIPHPPHRSIL